jgi:phosphocarrier protein
MGVMMLAAEYGSTITVEIEGPDETDALEAITEMFDQDQEA